MYTSVKHNQILQPLSSQQLHVGGDQKRSSSILGSGGRRVVDFKRSVNSMVRKSGRESTLFSDDLVINPMTSPLSSPKRGSFASSTSATSSMMHHTVATNITTPSLSPTSSQQTFASSDHHHHHPAQPPYYKEGVVIRKHLLETSGQKSKHREWKECFVVVGQGELKMYASQGNSGGGSGGTSSSNNNNGGGSNHGEERKSLLRASSINNFAALAESLSSSSNRSSVMAGTVSSSRAVT